MELFFGHAEVVMMVAFCLGVFCWKLDTARSYLDAIGAIAFCVMLLYVTGLVNLPRLPIDQVITAVQGDVKALGCDPAATDMAAQCARTTASVE